jgi:putative ABC transport system substrate-binding protein
MRRRIVLASLGSIGLGLITRPTAWAETKVYRVAFLGLDPGEDTSLLVTRLRQLGYEEGRNLSFTRRSAEGDPKRLPPLAAELVRANPDVIVTGWGTLAAKAAKEATTTIPVAFSTVGDPVGAGLVQNLARPGANVTGLSGQSNEFKGKQLQILREVVPAQVVGVLLNPDTPYSAIALAQLKAAAQADGTRLEVLEARSPEEFSAERLEGLVARGATSLFVFEDPLTGNIRHQVVEAATRLRLPIMAGNRAYALAGALIAYGPYTSDRMARIAEYVDKILRGVKPGDLPVAQPTQFQLFLNLTTAKALGIDIPPTLLARADEVIE